MTEKKQESKIFLMGLENSGKTSIILSLQRDTNLLSYYSLKPTKGIKFIDIEELHTNFRIWDFGGQIQYREEHLKKLPEVLDELKKLIYVIDIQDQEKYELSLTYFSEILKIVQKENNLPEISVFFHKFDPQFAMDEKILQELIDKVKKTVPSEFTYTIFKTTIYTIFRKDLLI